MKKHKHIPLGNGHITWLTETMPTDKKLQSFKEMEMLIRRGFCLCKIPDIEDGGSFCQKCRLHTEF